MREGTFSNALFHLKFKERVLGACGGGGSFFLFDVMSSLHLKLRSGELNFHLFNKYLLSTYCGQGLCD